ncbi:hypothetical protein CEXT_195891 [Caerostris extrusa]|uniref:Galectin n=1 Tax=Caerostris extrusa TaxID=172846 RepID=A0AAV4URL6_CAEEX|nr:hypothetical protein CEXT_195891 [Caerostris extrusa]
MKGKKGLINNELTRNFSLSLVSPTADFSPLGFHFNQNLHLKGHLRDVYEMGICCNNATRGRIEINDFKVEIRSAHLIPCSKSS